MTAGNYIFYIAILIGNIILVTEWAKYGLLECATVKNGRFVLGCLINTGTVFIAAFSGSFPDNRNATTVVVGVTVAVFFIVRWFLPPGMFAYNKASQRILHWYPTHYSDGKVLQAGEMLKKFSLAQNTAKLMETAIKSMQKENAVTSRLDLALAHEWLGLLYRMMNEFEKAEGEFMAGLAILEKFNCVKSEERAKSDALGHVLYRLGELDHVRGRYRSALDRYKGSLYIDESLGLESRVSITRKLVQQITDKVSPKSC